MSTGPDDLAGLSRVDFALLDGHTYCQGDWNDWPLVIYRSSDTGPLPREVVLFRWPQHLEVLVSKMRGQSEIFCDHGS